MGIFFNKSNLVNALWALLLGFIGFLGGLVWKGINGPVRVIISRDDNKNYKDTSITIIRFEGDSVAIKAFKDFQPQLLLKSYNENVDEKVLNVLRPKLELPKVVEGYTQASINSFASIEIQRNTFSKSEFIKLSINFFSKEILNKISPIFVDIVKEKSKNSVSLIWDEQFLAKGINNTIKFSADLPQGEYKLSLGFYFMDEIYQKYPPFYLKTFNVRII